jgi:alpha-ketoglutarate-dependent taurine dioxygenase
MSLQTRTRFATTDLAPLIGTEIRTDRETLLSGRHAAEIRQLLEQRGVLVVRELGLERADQLAFTATLGTPQLQGGREVLPISLDETEHQGREYLADYLQGSFYWHIDGSAGDYPNLANLLTAVKLSDTGGATQFANTYAAYEALAAEDKDTIADLKVVHSIEASQRYFKPEPSYAELMGWRRYPNKTHPLVWTHKSGRKSLVLGSTAAYVEGMSPEDSAALLTRLRDWAIQPQFVYQHDWTVGDLVIWDNTGTMHRATPYDPKSGRLMNRTILEGEETIA